MYDYQKELRHNFRQFQKQLQPMVTTHRKVTHRGKARYVRPCTSFIDRACTSTVSIHITIIRLTDCTTACVHWI